MGMKYVPENGDIVSFELLQGILVKETERDDVLSLIGITEGGLVMRVGHNNLDKSAFETAVLLPQPYPESMSIAIRAIKAIFRII